ncbi:hypothetical protein CDH05_21285 [Pseudomonas lactis]|nr:hypothetical protein CDH05_21285 [Pseudomonas lactis]
MSARRPDENAQTHQAITSPVGASLLAKNPQAPRLVRKHALSLTCFASKLAPTWGIRRTRNGAVVRPRLHNFRVASDEPRR